MKAARVRSITMTSMTRDRKGTKNAFLSPFPISSRKSVRFAPASSSRRCPTRSSAQLHMQTAYPVPSSKQRAPPQTKQPIARPRSTEPLHLDTLAACIPQTARLIEDEAARHMLHRLQYTPLQTALRPEVIQTSHVVSRGGGASDPVVVFLHGFDSNLLEFRYILPMLDALPLEAHFVDILGWGLTEKPSPGKNFHYGPAAKRAHLEAYLLKFASDRKVTLVGASIGGAVAIDYLLHANHRQQIDGLVLIDPQAFIDKKETAIMKLPCVAEAGSELLRSNWLRKMAIGMSYHCDSFKQDDDVLRICGLHCHTPGWLEATTDFVRGAGYCISNRVADVKAPTLVLWGENDRVLPKQDAKRMEGTIKGSLLEFIKESGHSPHIENPAEVMKSILSFLDGLRLHHS